MQNINACPGCASTNIVHSKDQVICKDCALIFEPFAAVDTTRSQPQTVLSTAPTKIKKAVKNAKKKR